MAVRVKSGESRESGWLYFVKGKTLEVWKAKMARGRKKGSGKKKATKRKTTAKRKTTKRKTTKRRR
ncbi:MAG: hypothetical protein QGF74_03485 [Candidatus Nanoarchaeia archaeon]|jgi:hypothetical protein|nr:hypothetical protein [Candidatus Nanoarchaeia archaeon]|tara:strand:- start:43390 stop:43587 length:198 start_codon:yes stop_codon:yes gene_type:complete